MSCVAFVMVSINASIYTYIVFKQMSVCFCVVIDNPPPHRKFGCLFLTRVQK